MADIDPLVLLNDTLERCIPITRAMGIIADSYDGSRLRLSAPASPNLNDKQTAFAGSFLFHRCPVRLEPVVYETGGAGN